MSQKKRSIQTRLPTVSTGEASSANQHEGQRTEISDLLAEITKVGATLNVVASDVSLIKSDTTELKNAVSAIQLRLTGAENRISDMEDQVANVAKDKKLLAKKLDLLWARADDQENRHRQKNIRLVGLKEGMEGNGALCDYIRKLISDGLGLDGVEYEIESCYRSPGPRPGPNQPPRIILVRTKTYGEALFHHHGPRLWNRLLENLGAAETVEVFKKRLKTHFCNLAFS
ncbi:uncharacterized protein LOC111947549 [Oryzias latipes]|uniref:uncharacterized protein LOC111947549 n=1 Tax=Oryzias latipes TaxID=8090 RepID=UPI000CE25097|nr:uncharacterized protein LOC111947549 [Oryzias latipes]